MTGPIAPGSRLGPYEILAPLGAGGMGEVWRAKDPRLDREVAIKVLPAEVAGDASRLKRFEKEARSASALNHPNIVTIYEIGTSDSVAYIAMERVEGKTLRELLFGGAIPIKRLLPIAAQIADGLARAHEAGIVHRDLKPENLMVTRDGLVKILDFGLAKQTAVGSGSDEGSHIPTETGTSPGVVLGTVGYMSPEQAAGQPVNFRSDQFALGSILYEMATGKRAFQKGTAVDTLSAILHEEPKPVGESRPEAPAPLRWIIERCLAKEPGERYGTSRDLARDLATIRDRVSETVSGGTPASVAPRPRRILRLALVAAVIVGLTALATRWISKAPPSFEPSFQRITFGNGLVDAARFSADGRTIIYSALWDGKPPHVFLTRPEAPESQRLDLPDGSLASVSQSGELAIISGKQTMAAGPWFTGGTLATAPLAGGTPREIAENIRFADWAPDGKRMLVNRGGKLQFPLGGKVLHDRGYVPRISPAGDKVAFTDGSQVHVTDTSGREITASKRYEGGWSVRSLAWSPSGDEVWFTEGGETTTLYALRLDSTVRTLYRTTRGMSLQDVSRDGRVLMDVGRGRREVWAGSFSRVRERNLTVFGTSNAMGISADGTMLLDNEDAGFYLLRTDGSPPKKLGVEFASELSPDGKWAAVVRPGPPEQLVLVPTGAGEEKVLERGSIDKYVANDVRWSGDGRGLLFGASEKDGVRLYTQDVAGGPPRPLTPAGLEIQSSSISPDGRFVLVEEKGYWIYPVGGGQKRRVGGLRDGVDFVGRNWSDDGRFVYAWDPTRLPFEVSRVELSTGRREAWKTIAPQDPSGIYMGDLMITPDGKSYAYNCTRMLSDLYLVTGVR